MNAIVSKTDRAKLQHRREPYWARLMAGGYVGFRKLDAGEGTWIARWRDEGGRQHYRALGHFEEYDQATKAARLWIAQNQQGANPKATTVEAACKAYEEALLLDQRRNTAKDVKGRFRRLVYGSAFGKIPLDRLKTTDVRRWLGGQIEQADDDDGEGLRRAKDSANRNLATLKAALNRALSDRLVATDSGWKTVRAFEKVGARRKNAFLSIEARLNLLGKCGDDLRLLVKAMLLTGARPGELAALNASDFDRKFGTVTFRGKTGERTVAVSTAAAAFLSELAKDRIGNAPMLASSTGGRWTKDSWKKPFKEAALAAELPSDVVLYSLRHTAISEMIMGGMDSFVVAKLTGTSVQMIESNYGHLHHDKVRDKLDSVRMF
jgi:integrase